jgi:hypothetical protein
VLAEDDHTYLWVFVAQAGRRLNPFIGVAGWHADVGHDHIRAVAFDCGEQAFEVDAAAGQVDVGVRLQKSAHTLSNQVAVLGQYHSDPRRHGGVRMPPPRPRERPYPHPSKGVPPH